jgi:hypothetical protein
VLYADDIAFDIGSSIDVERQRYHSLVLEGSVKTGMLLMCVNVALEARIEPV